MWRRWIDRALGRDGESASGDGAAAAEFERRFARHRSQLLTSRLGTVSIAVMLLTLNFEIVSWVLIPERWANEWPLNLVLIVAPLIGLVGVYGPFRNSPQAVYLAADFAYTIAVVGRLLLPSAWTSGISSFTAIKLMGTAILIPWSPRLQAVSVVYTMALYWTLMVVSGRVEVAGGELPHQLTSPLFAAFLSLVGTVGADRLRRRMLKQQIAAEREARVSSHFAATMSHELRNLLTAMVGYGEMLDDVLREGEGDTVLDVPRRLQTLGRQGLDVINVTLDLSRAEHEGPALRLEAFDVRGLLVDMSTEFPPEHLAAGVTLHWRLPDEPLPLQSDSLKIKMILRNLIGNALKFTPGGEVTVSARRVDPGVELEVADTGSGIAAQELEAIFEPFRQSTAGHGRQGSAGLGLYVVSRLTEALGATIRVQSELGRGSVFRIQVPQRAPAEA